MLKFLEIAKSWIAAANPTDEQKEIAEYRIQICNSCEFMEYSRPWGEHVCNRCNCPLSKKIFSPTLNGESCPEGKWKQ